MEEESTRERIRRCALKEFQENGFHGASLRKIVKKAGVTTGAFYGYYETKEALYADLVGPCVEHIYQMVDDNYQRFVQQGSAEQIRNMRDNSGTLTEEMLDYVYAHHEIFRLVLTASEGTEYADFIHNLALREEESTIRFAAMLKEAGMEVTEPDPEFVHMIASGMFSSAFEIVLHNMHRDQAAKRIRMLSDFYTAGWAKVLGVAF